jgi:hypothetical protein
MLAGMLTVAGGASLRIGRFMAVRAPRIPADCGNAHRRGVACGGYSTPELPPWFLATGYALLGWSVGLKFTGSVRAAAARALPQALSSIAAMIAFCGALAWLLVRVLGIDPLTAYLTTSPGGADSGHHCRIHPSGHVVRDVAADRPFPVDSHDRAEPVAIRGRARRRRTSKRGRSGHI